MASKFVTFYKFHGNTWHLIISNTLSKNKVSERKNWIIFNRAHTMFVDTNLLPSLWLEALNTAILLINSSPTRASSRITLY